MFSTNRNRVSAAHYWFCIFLSQNPYFAFQGAFRKGKSFLLNVLLHRLHAEGDDGEVKRNLGQIHPSELDSHLGQGWLEGGTKGFPTLGGSEGVTQVGVGFCPFFWQKIPVSQAVGQSAMV